MQRYDEWDILGLQIVAGMLILLGALAIFAILRDLWRENKRRNRKLLPPPARETLRDYYKERYK